MNHPIIIGFSVGIESPLRLKGLEKTLLDMLDAGCTAIELHPHLEDYPTGEILLIDFVKIIKSFDYRSIHLPVIKGLDTNKPAINYCLALAELIDAETLVLHPDIVKSAKSVAALFDSTLAIENMDWRKNYGKSISDLGEQFNNSPEVKWVCDLNHVKTNDPTMKLADDLHQSFKNRLVHYHISGFQASAPVPHAPLYQTREDEIIKAIRDDTKPVIVESFGPANIQNFPKELTYIKSRI